MHVAITASAEFLFLHSPVVSACCSVTTTTILLLLRTVPRSTLVCCNPEDNLNYPNLKSDYGYPEETEPWVEIATPAGECILNITYFEHADLSHDGLCVGTIKAEW